MKKYSLFYVKNDIYNMYKHNSYILYQTLKSISDLSSKNIRYGKSLYEQLCIPYDLKIINKYLLNKYTLLIRKNNKYWFINSYTGEHTLVKLKYSRIIVETNTDYPEILKVLSFYSYKLFVCDFKFDDYFWLSSKIGLSSTLF